MRSRRKELSTFRRLPSEEDSVSLFTRRKSSIVPLSSSPFVKRESPVQPQTKPVRKHVEDGLKVYAAKLEWSDLLLELAMTTTFSNLTDNTSVQTGTDLVSFISFFFLVWWIWASQVAYNVRFRQSDWFHRIFVFLQLLIFGSLAAFTSGYNIGITTKENDEIQNEIHNYEEDIWTTQSGLTVATYRDNQLPLVNSRGISIVMGCSRMVLFAQYYSAYYHVLRVPEEQSHLRKPTTIASIALQFYTLLVSATCFFITMFVGLGNNADNKMEIMKVILWYIPLLIEIAMHFVAHQLKGHVRYDAGEIFKRSSTVFIIILGGGLDRITNGFQYVVGNVSIGPSSAFQIICAAVIFILLFTLYFGSSDGNREGSRRALAHFFFQFFYLSALIVTLQGIASMLRVGNLAQALDTPFQFVLESRTLLENKGFGVEVNKTDYSDTLINSLINAGVDIENLLRYINMGIENGFEENDEFLPYNTVLYETIPIIKTVLENIDAMPEEGTLVWAQMEEFSSHGASNSTIVNPTSFYQIANGIVTANARPALWFYVAGGSVFITLALTSLIGRLPRDRFEWGQISSRLIMGTLIICFTVIDLNATSDVLTDKFTYQGSRIWFLATHAWILPPYALALLVEQLVELILLHLAGRGYTFTDEKPADEIDDNLSDHFNDRGPFSEEPKELSSPSTSAARSTHEDTSAMQIMKRYKQASMDSTKEPLIDHHRVSM